MYVVEWVQSPPPSLFIVMVGGSIVRSTGLVSLTHSRHQTRPDLSSFACVLHILHRACFISLYSPLMPSHFVSPRSTALGRPSHLSWVNKSPFGWISHHNSFYMVTSLTLHPHSITVTPCPQHNLSCDNTATTSTTQHKEETRLSTGFIIAHLL